MILRASLISLVLCFFTKLTKSIALNGRDQSIEIFCGTYEIRIPFLIIFVPSSGFKISNDIFAVVDLPDPLGPINVTISPWETFNETPLTNHLWFLKTPQLFNSTK